MERKRRGGRGGELCLRLERRQAGRQGGKERERMKDQGNTGKRLNAIESKYRLERR